MSPRGRDRYAGERPPPWRARSRSSCACPGGRAFLSQVPGVAQSALDDAALAAVLNWMLEHFDHEHMPATFTLYTAAEVGTLRRTQLTNVEQVRRTLLQALAGRH